MPTMVEVYGLGAVALILLVLLFIWLKVRQIAAQELPQILVEELRRFQEDGGRQARDLREEVAAVQARANEVLVRTVNTLGHEQKDMLERVRQTVDEKLRQVLEDQRRHLLDVISALKELEKVELQEQEKAREILDQKFRTIQESNEKKLEEMRRTVDEKLHDTLEKRIGESFRLVSERLEAVQRGLGDAVPGQRRG